MARQVSVQVEIAGDALPSFSQLTIEQTVESHHNFEIQLPVDHMLAAMGKKSNQTLDLKFNECKTCIGQEVKIAFESKFELKNSENYFKGIVTEVFFSRHYASSVDLIIRGKSPTIMMEDGKNSRSFEEMNAKDVVESIVNQYDGSVYKHEFSETFTDAIDYLVQYQESNFHFINRIASYYGEWYFYDGSVMYYGRPPSGKAVELHLGRELNAFNLSLRLIPLKFKNWTYDVLKNEVVNESSSSENVNGLDSFGQFTYDESNRFFTQEPLASVNRRVKDKPALKEIIKVDKSIRSNELVIFSGESNHSGLKLGQEINVSGNKIDKNKENETYGKYRIIHLWHFIDGTGSYHNQFEAISASLEHPPPNERIQQPFCETQGAVIKDNDDPEKMGRVRVQFFWQEGSDKSPWIRLVASASGDNKGFYFVPEKDDEVMVAFENGHPDRPYVLGCVYHGKNKPSDFHDKDNYIKAIRTPSGNEIHLIDKPGKEEIKIFNKDEANIISLSLDGSETITIKSNQTINVSATDININASNNISISATEKISVACKELEVNVEEGTAFSSGKGVEMSAGEGMELSVGQGLEIGAGQGVDISAGTSLSTSSGTDTEINAGANLKASASVNAEIGANVAASLAGNAKAEVKGSGMLTLESSGITTLKGSMVNIN